MAMQTPFFGKRDADAATGRHQVPQAPLHARTAAGPHALPTTPAPAAAPAPALPVAILPPEAEAASPPVRSTLTVGPNIKLKGVEITDCDTLMVEGIVEATMDSRLMRIAPCGAFHGAAQIDVAEIHGQFEGTLTVREKLVVHATGRVNGTIRYGRLVVEEGGQLSGDLVQGVSPVPAAPPAAKALLQAA